MKTVISVIGLCLSFLISFTALAQNDCTSPINFGALPIVQTGLSTCGTLNDFSSADVCGSVFMDGEDYFIRFGVPADGCYQINLTNTAANTGVFLYDGCPNNGATNCLASDEAPAGNPSVTANLLFGQAYMVMISTTAGQGCTPFDVEIVECPPQPGDDCSTPFPVVTFPYAQAGLTTCNAGDDYDDTDACTSVYMNGEDFTIEFTPTVTDCHLITLSNTATFTGFHVFDGCPDNGATTCIDFATSETGNPSLEIPLTAGTPYYITISTLPAPDCTNFDINIDPCPPPAPGDDCTIPYTINAVPFNQAGLTTCNADDDYDDTDACTSNYMTGEDFIIEFTAPSTDCFEFDLTATGTWTGVFILDGCPDDAATNCISSATESGGNPTLQENLISGQTYTIVVSTASPPDCTDFDLAIDTCPPVPPGTDCVNPFFIPGGIFYNEAGATTCGFGDEYDDTDACTSNYMNGEDFVYQFTPSLDTCYQIDLSNTDTWVGVHVLDGCPDAAGTTCIGDDTNSAGNPLVQVQLDAGQPYFIVISTFPNPNCTPFDIDIGICPPPPAPAFDCDIALAICNNSNLNLNSLGMGLDDFADPDNLDGCLSNTTPENQSSWMTIEIDNSTPAGSTLGFDILPNVASDYDFAIWGPNVVCDNLGAPLRCSWAAGTNPTGLDAVSGDTSEGAGGNGYVSEIIVNPGETYILMVDNWSENNNGFQLNWSGSAALSCNAVCPADGGTASSIPQPGNVSTNFPFPSSDPEHFILCIGDRFEFQSNNDFLLPPPAAGEVSEIMWGVFTAMPQASSTIGDPAFTGWIIPDTNIDDINNMAENSTLPNGYVLTNNTLYLVPITVDDGDDAGNPNGMIGVDTDGDGCYDFGQPMVVTYLDNISHTATDECGGPAITIMGGMPEFFSSVYTLSNLIPATASFSNPTPTHNETFTINGIGAGDGYSFSVEDANGCTYNINGSFNYAGPFPDLAPINPVAVCGTTYDLVNIGVNDFNSAGGVITYHDEGLVGEAGAELGSTIVNTSGTYYAITTVGIPPAVCKDTTFVDLTLQTNPDLTLATTIYSGCSPYDASLIIPTDNNATGGTLTYHNDDGTGQAGTQITALTLANMPDTGGAVDVFIISTIGACTDTISFNLTVNNCCLPPNFINN